MSPELLKIIKRSGLAIIAILVLALGAGIVVGYASAGGFETANTALAWVLGVVAILLMVLAVWMGAAWMRNIDEAAQEAHKWAWYWGGTSGMAAAGVLVIMANLPQTAALRLPSLLGDRTDPAAYLASGAFGMMGALLVGYMVAWGWWWMRRR